MFKCASSEPTSQLWARSLDAEEGKANPVKTEAEDFLAFAFYRSRGFSKVETGSE